MSLWRNTIESSQVYEWRVYDCEFRRSKSENLELCGMFGGIRLSVFECMRVWF